MEIEAATRQALSSLTFDERPLAKELFNAQQTAKIQNRVWLRAPTLRLSTALTRAHSLAKEQGFTAKFINLYCDTLIVEQDEVTPENDKTGSGPVLVLELFARKIESATPGANNTLTFNMSAECEIVFWTPSLPSTLTLVAVLRGNETTHLNPKVSSGNFGISYRYDGISLGTEEYEALDVEPKVFDYLNLIQADGTIKDRGMVSDHIARLFQFQFLIAQANAGSNRQLAVDLLAYLIAGTKNSAGALLNYQACSLWSSLTLKSEVTTVSSVNVYASKQILKARLLAALSFEQAFRQFSLASNSTEIQSGFALNMLSKSDDALETYKFLLANRQREYDDALIASEKATATFQKNQADIEALQLAFQAGVDAYKKDKEMEAAKGIIKGVIGVAIAIGAVVATGGLAAPAAIPAAAGAVSAASKVATLIAKLKEVFARLKAIYEKLKPVIAAIQEVVKTVSQVISAIKKLETKTSGAKTLKPDTHATDVHNVTAEWKNFDITVREMEDSLREYEISGKREYFHSLKALVNNGQAYILTQASLVQRGTELATTLLQRKMETRDHGRLETLSASVGTNAVVFDLLKRAMFDRLLSIRGLVYLDFHTYSLAYHYHTLRKDSIISLSPVKPAVDYLDDAAKLQGAIVAFGSTTRIQSRTFVLNSLCGFASGEELGSTLVAGRKVSFAVAPEDPVWQGFNRIRMTTTRCYLEGLRWKIGEGESRSIRIGMKTDGRFFDLDRVPRSSLFLEGAAAKGTSSAGSSLVQDPSPDLVTVTRAFVGDPRSLLFEYEPGTGKIICDGQWGQLRDYTKHSPMSTWEIGINVSPSKLAELDYSDFTGLRLEFDCEVIYKDL